MCFSVAFTVGCTFATAEEANKAAAAAPSRVEAASGCASILYTSACTFADIKEAAAAAQLHLEGASQSNAKCGEAGWTIVCTV